MLYKLSGLKLDVLLTFNHSFSTQVREYILFASQQVRVSSSGSSSQNSLAVRDVSCSKLSSFINTQYFYRKKMVTKPICSALFWQFPMMSSIALLTTST